VLQTNDIGQLFATLQAAYGHQWAHKADAIPVWRAKLNNFSPRQIMAAASEAIERHPDFPPSVGQFLEVLRAGQPRPTNYLPPPPFDKGNHDKAMAYMDMLRNMTPLK